MFVVEYYSILYKKYIIMGYVGEIIVFGVGIIICIFCWMIDIIVIMEIIC